MSSNGLMNLELEKEKIEKLVFEISFYYLHDPILRYQFLIDERKVINSYIRDYRHGKTDFFKSLEKIRAHYQILIKIHSRLQMNNIQLYAIAMKERDATSIKTLSLKGVGFASGLFQIIGGVGFCAKDIRTACKKIGIPLLIQGGENTYENAYYLFVHKEPKVVPVRQVYRYVSKLLGGDNEDGDIVFSSVDIGLSVGSLGGLTQSDSARRLFYYIRDDFIRGWKTMGGAGIGSELIGDASSSFSIYQILSKPETNWAELQE